ncbi:MAG: hypothetical protein AB1798_13870 [Spirochaetota bacterium]
MTVLCTTPKPVEKLKASGPGSAEKPSEEAPKVENRQPEPQPKPEIEAESPAVMKTEIVKPAADTPPNGGFTVTQDTYDKTFKEIEAIILELNNIIKSEDFDTWRKYLTDDYRKRLETPAVLSDISNQPILKKYNIKLRTLRDYFSYVVVPSRSNARLDEIVIADDSHVKAIMLVNGQRSILYQLEKIDGAWKISY